MIEKKIPGEIPWGFYFEREYLLRDMEKTTKDKNILAKALPDRYRIEDVLGQGGMGIVFRAHDQFLDHTVSIKLLKNKGDFEKNAIRFQQEAKALSKLNHENLATLLDFDIAEDNSFYMVYRFVEGTTLKKFVKENSPVPMKKALTILVQIASCLSYIHKKGITHRDIKSTNILVYDKDEQVSTYILDFGIAKMTGNSFIDAKLTQAGGMIGTPNYMSPEVARGLDADERSDIYSFGCVAFELIAGQVPFRAESSLELLKMHNDVEAPTLEESCLRDDLVPELSTLISSCLSKDPEARPQTIERINLQLKEILEDLSADVESNSNIFNIEVPPIALPSDNPRPEKFNKPLIVSTAILASILLFFIASQEGKIVKTHSNNLEKMGSEGTAITSTLIPQTRQVTHTEFILDRYTKSVGAIKMDAIVVVKGNKDSEIDWSELAKFKREVYLRLESTILSKDDIKQIVTYPKVTGLNFGIQESMDDEWLKYISTKKNLVLLQLVAPPAVTPRGYGYLKDMNSLKELSISSSSTSLDHLKAIKDIDSLEILKFRNDTVFDDNHLKYLSKYLPNLIKLDLDSCKKLKGKTIASTTRWKNLKFLFLYNTNIGDDAIESLVKAKSKIKELDLTGTDISTKGFKKLNQLPELNTVTFSYGKNLSDAELNAFAKAMKFKTRKKDKAAKLNGFIGKPSENIDF